MGDHAPLPLARVWQMSGGDVDDPTFARAYCTDVVPMLEEVRGYLGQFVMLDPEHRVLRGISFWEDAKTREASWVVVARVVDALTRLSTSSFAGAWDFEVVVHDFHDVLAAPSQRGDVSHLQVRTGMLRGGTVADRSVVDALKEYQVKTLAPAPGCLGTLLLRDPLGPALLGSSFWTGPEAEARTETAGLAVLREVEAATGSTSTSVGRFDVLVNDPMQIPVR